ncbi:hypothetical protein CRUP_007863 [Coryphaenoides rupestris]|nr:hypothetical protein CRUP_007863 [Coryphaenoides rupestris]
MWAWLGLTRPRPPAREPGWWWWGRGSAWISAGRRRRRRRRRSYPRPAVCQRVVLGCLSHNHGHRKSPRARTPWPSSESHHGGECSWRTMSPPRRTATGRRWCWTARRCRLTFWTRRARRTTLPSGTTTSAAERASSASSPSPSWSRSPPPWTSGSRSYGSRRTRMFPSCLWGTSRTWRTGDK